MAGVPRDLSQVNFGPLARPCFEVIYTGFTELRYHRPQEMQSMIALQHHYTV